MLPACCFRQRTCVAQGLFNGVLNGTFYWEQERVQVSLSTPLKRPCATHSLTKATSWKHIYIYIRNSPI